MYISKKTKPRRTPPYHTSHMIIIWGNHLPAIQRTTLSATENLFILLDTVLTYVDDVPVVRYHADSVSHAEDARQLTRIHTSQPQQ